MPQFFNLTNSELQCMHLWGRDPWCSAGIKVIFAQIAGPGLPYILISVTWSQLTVTWIKIQAHFLQLMSLEVFSFHKFNSAAFQSHIASGPHKQSEGGNAILGKLFVKDIHSFQIFNKAMSARSCVYDRIIINFHIIRILGSETA